MKGEGTAKGGQGTAHSSFNATSSLTHSSGRTFQPISSSGYYHYAEYARLRFCRSITFSPILFPPLFLLSSAQFRADAFTREETQLRRRVGTRAPPPSGYIKCARIAVRERIGQWERREHFENERRMGPKMVSRNDEARRAR